MGRITFVAAGCFGFRIDELHGDGVVTILFDDAHNFGWLRSVERGGSGGIREGNLQTLALPISSSRGREEQAVARDVNAFANFFKGSGESIPRT